MFVMFYLWLGVLQCHNEKQFHQLYFHDNFNI